MKRTKLLILVLLLAGVFSLASCLEIGDGESATSGEVTTDTGAYAETDLPTESSDSREDDATDAPLDETTNISPDEATKEPPQETGEGIVDDTVDNTEEETQCTHIEVIDPRVEPTCTEDGLTEGRHCGVCGEVLVAREVIKGEHKPGEWVVSVLPSCTQEGEKRLWCEACGDLLETSTVPTSAHDYDGERCRNCYAMKESGGLDFVWVNGGYAVSGIGNCSDTELYIPSAYKGEAVVEIADLAFVSNSSIEKLYIPASVRRIGDQAFLYCGRLSEISFAENGALAEIGESAFSNTALEEFFIPEGVTTVGAGAFNGCKSLRKISMPPTVKSIGKNTFRYCPELCEVLIADIGAWCSVSLENKYSNPIYLAKSVRDGEGNVLSRIVIPEDCTVVAKYAFYGAGDINSVVFPRELVKIDEYAFGECKIDAVVISDLAAWCGVSRYSEDSLSAQSLVLDGRRIVNLEIPSGVSRIESYAFAGFNIVNATLPDGLSSVGEGVFMNCQGLKTVTLPETLTKIEDKMFNNCRSLYQININNTLSYIGASAFGGCYSLESVTIPESTVYIGQGAFEDCTGLVSITFACTSGWVCESSTGDRNIASYRFESAESILEAFDDYSYGAWRRK